MICRPCRDAADRLTAAVNWSALEGLYVAPSLAPLYAAAREAHQACLGRTSCDCQHKVERHGHVQR